MLVCLFEQMTVSSVMEFTGYCILIRSLHPHDGEYLYDIMAFPLSMDIASCFIFQHIFNLKNICLKIDIVFCCGCCHLLSYKLTHSDWRMLKWKLTFLLLLVLPFLVSNPHKLIFKNESMKTDIFFCCGFCLIYKLYPKTHIGNIYMKLWRSQL